MRHMWRPTAFVHGPCIWPCCLVARGLVLPAGECPNAVLVIEIGQSFLLVLCRIRIISTPRRSRRSLSVKANFDWQIRLSENRGPCNTCEQRASALPKSMLGCMHRGVAAPSHEALRGSTDIGSVSAAFLRGCKLHHSSPGHLLQHRHPRQLQCQAVATADAVERGDHLAPTCYHALHASFFPFCSQLPFS